MKAFNNTSKVLISANIQHELAHRPAPIAGKQQMIYVKGEDIHLLESLKKRGYSLSELFSIALHAAK